MKRRILLGVLPTSGMCRVELHIDAQRLNELVMEARINDGKTELGDFTMLLLPASERQLATAAASSPVHPSPS